MTITHWLVLLGLIIIAGLTTYAAVLWRRVWQVRRQLQSRESARNERLAGDIQLLAQSLLNAQVPVTEGAIRIKVLLDNYSGPRPTGLDVQVFESIYEATAHIPTHQAWKDLPRAERVEHMEQMEILEEEHRAEVDRAAKQLSKRLTES